MMAWITTRKKTFHSLTALIVSVVGLGIACLGAPRALAGQSDILLGDRVLGTVSNWQDGNAASKIENYINVVNANIAYILGQADYWWEMYLYYASIQDGINAANAYNAYQAFLITADSVTMEKNYWVKYYGAAINARNSATRFMGGILDDDFGSGSAPGRLSQLQAFYETGELPSSSIPGWDGMPEASASHRLISALTNGSDYLLLLMFDTRAATLPGSTAGAFLARNFIVSAAYLDQPQLTVKLDGNVWYSYPDMAGASLSDRLDLNVPHRVEVALSSAVMDGSAFPSWGHTTRMEMTLFSFDYTLKPVPVLRVDKDPIPPGDTATASVRPDPGVDLTWSIAPRDGDKGDAAASRYPRPGHHGPDNQRLGSGMDDRTCPGSGCGS
ncbi:MAG: hypothetical protein V1793_21445 [Pseudomonadota bacterium]